MAHLPPIAQSAERLLVVIEQAVRAFPRYHRYALGQDLRTQAMAVVRLCHRAWRDRIEAFLAAELKLSLKAEQKLQPLTGGIDFLGYVVRPTHTLVRHRVVGHAREALAAWERAHVVDGALRATPADLRRIQSTAASYAGHLRHANSHRLQAALHHRFRWLRSATRARGFHHRLEGRPLTIPIRRPA